MNKLFHQKSLAQIDISDTKILSQFIFQNGSTTRKGGGSHQLIQGYPDIFPIHYLFAKTNRNVPKRVIDSVSIRRCWERLRLISLAIELKNR